MKKNRDILSFRLHFDPIFVVSPSFSLIDILAFFLAGDQFLLSEIDRERLKESFKSDFVG